MTHGNKKSQMINQILYARQVLVEGNKTLNLTDSTTIQIVTAEATIIIPPNSSVAFLQSTQIAVVSLTSSDITISPGSDVTIRSKDSKLKIDGQYSSVSLIKLGTDEWLLVGALKA